jgi:RimJ/RimL family protein N-acetyltransferase
MALDGRMARQEVGLMTAIKSSPYVRADQKLSVEIRGMAPADAPGVLKFASTLPLHDLLFLSRDIRNSRVMAAWLDEIAKGTIHTLVALSETEVVGCVAIVSDQLSWSSHVGDIRLLIRPDLRGTGLGRHLLKEGFALALGLDLEKLTARMTPDQLSAIALFEELGFRPEALLREHVRDANGVAHDLAVFSLLTKRSAAQRNAYRMGE